MNKKYLLAIPALFLIGCGAGEATKSDTDRLNEQVNGNTPVATKSVAPKVSTITEGDWEVGTKDNYNANILTPGEYVVTAPENSIVGCYWTVVKDFSGDLDAFITAGNVEGGKSGRMLIKKSHGGVELNGDCLVKKKKG